MKLKVIEIKKIEQGVPSITFCKNGRIILNPSAVNKLKIKDGNRIQFLQDEEAPEDVYIKISSSDGLRCGINKNGVSLYSHEFVGKLLRLLKKCDTIRFRIATVPIDGHESTYAIFTSNSIFRGGKAKDRTEILTKL